MLRRIRAAVAPYPKAALFELAEEGHDSVFEQLVACIVSIRTLDEQTLPISRRIFARGRTAAALRALPLDELDALVRPSTFHRAKAAQLLAIAARVEDEFGDQLPCDFDVLTSFSGVGPKCAHLVLGIACKTPSIAVDVHVHRVTNRWGYIQAPTPEKTMSALSTTLPRRYWIEINRLLVPFGKHVCTGVRPKCSTCPVLEWCEQVGVTSHR